jgi:NAD(P)-dependent dehydrogenase (short-subunit alcohol dehydrogenase family)
MVEEKPMRLQSKVAVITGAGSGMGRATAVLFAEEGAKPVVVDVDEKSGQATMDTIKEKGQEALFIPTEVTNRSQVKSMVARVVESYGKVDVLVNSVGIWRLGNVVDVEEEEWDNH